MESFQNSIKGTAHGGSDGLKWHYFPCWAPRRAAPRQRIETNGLGMRRQISGRKMEVYPTVIFRARRSFWPQSRRSPRNGVVRTLSALPFKSRRWRSAWHRSPRLPTRFLTTDVPESKEESYEVAGEGKSLRLRNRPRSQSHEGSGGRTNVERGRSLFRFPSAVCCRIVTFVTGKKSSAACRVPTRRGGRLSLRRHLLLNCARRGAVQSLLLVRCAIAVTHQCC